MIDPISHLCRYLGAQNLAAIILDEDSMLGKLLLNTIRFGSWEIDLVDRYYYGHPGSLCMVDSFYRAFDESLRERSEDMELTVNEITTPAV